MVRSNSGRGRKTHGKALSLGIETQRANVSMCLCTSECACMFGDGKENAGEKGSQETAILPKRRQETLICGTKKKIKIFILN